MASKSFSLFSLALFVLLSLVFAHSVSAGTKKKSPVEFLKHLQGCHKGQKVKGILQLKKYLEQFGYLDYKHSKNRNHENDDDFDELLESAVRNYQLNFHLNCTGVLDRQTLSKMAMPRCGVADVINGTNLMKSSKKPHHHNDTGSPFHTVSHFVFFPRSPKWPNSQTHLTYAFLPGTRGDAMEPVARAFQTWQANTHFTFSRVLEGFTNANIKIGFGSGEHGDRHPFDGPGRTLAHAYAPTDGRLHFDADERWAVGAVPGSYDMQTVALHEIGHLLGLDHSTVEGAIMYPTINPGATKGLHSDDIQGIRTLYQV